MEFKKGKIEAVIFDWAGTTVDYGSFAPVQAFVEAFKKFGITPTSEEARGPMGMLKRNHIQTLMELPRIRDQWAAVHGKDWTDSDVDAVYRESEGSILPILKDFADPKPFVIETIAALREAGIKIGSTTGYTDEMMAIVAPTAAKAGYAPDSMFTPNSVGDLGRPYPFMAFKNLEALKVSSVAAALKVGDTVADIKEGKNAGMISVGIIEGSSVMGLSLAEYQALSEEEREDSCERVRKAYMDCGADYVLLNMSGLVDLIFDINKG